jgi:OmpA-OmpF porin, OOP family
VSPVSKRAFASRSVKLAGVAAALVLAAAPPVGAQPAVPGFALDRFDPSVPVDAFFGVGSPAVGGHLVPRAVVEFEDATHPLQVTSGAMTTTNVVSAQGFLHAGLSLALWDRVLLSADMPFAVVDSGSDPTGTTLDYHAPSSTALGDLRLGARGRIFGGLRDPFQMGVQGAVYLPTGSPDAYTSRGTTRGSADLLFGGRAGSGIGVVWSASA